MTQARNRSALALVAALVVCLAPLVSAAAAETPTRGKALEPAPPDWGLEGDAENGRIIYKQYCQKCHGKRGDGHGLMAKDLDPKPQDFTDAEVMNQRSDWDLYLGIKEGGAAVGLSDQMTAWEDTLTEDEMQDVTAFIRQFANPPEE